jgi:hypothetical protein
MVGELHLLEILGWLLGKGFNKDGLNHCQVDNIKYMDLGSK